MKIEWNIRTAVLRCAFTLQWTAEIAKQAKTLLQFYATACDDKNKQTNTYETLKNQSALKLIA